MSAIKVSDYIAQFLVDNEIKDVFLISGGGMMHLLDSVGKHPSLNCVYNLNEQASSICAESYAQYTNHLGVCMVTTGPGATNAITGCAGAWCDSTPVLYISGQAKREQLGQLKGLRQYGAQEIAIIPMVTPITKYSMLVLDKNMIRYHLEKAVYLATHGRKGPVWLDIPLDIQGAVVHEEDLIPFYPQKEDLLESHEVSDDDILATYHHLNAARRPVILIGHGVIASGKASLVRELSYLFQIPVLATWRAKGVFGDEEDLFMGSPGIPATRFSNYVLQNADLVLIIGSRLNAAITAYDEKRFAYNAKKIIVDIDQNEINKLDIEFDVKIVSDAGAFLEKISDYRYLYQYPDSKDWLSYCTHVKNKYPLNKEQQQYDNDGKTDGYVFAEALSHYSTEKDVFIGSSSGRTCPISHMAYQLKAGQKFITSMGLGSMGWCIPSAIASCIASNRKRTLVFEGDGSLQHNLQELALIQTYNLPLKIFVYSNGGYASIFSMQRNNFNSRFAGCDEDSGLQFPSLKDIAETYNLAYYCIENNEQINDVLVAVMKDNQPVLCEVIGSINFDEIPKSVTVANPDGSFSSSHLENLYPFVSDDEQRENMPDWS